jgi:hypothetical protein
MLRGGRRRHFALDGLFGEVAVGELAHETRAHRARGTVPARAVHDQVHADALVRVKAQRAVKVLRVAPVADDAAPAVAQLEEPEQHAVERRHDVQASGESPARGVCREDAPARALAIPQPGDHELRHVGDRGRRAAGGGDAEHLERIGGSGAQQVAARHARAETLRQHLPGRRRRHAERHEHVAVHVVVVGFSADPFDDVAGERDAVIAVGWHFPRRIDALGHPGLQVLLRGREAVRPIGHQALDRLLEPGRVRHEVAQRHGLPAAGRDPEIQVIVDVAVEVQASRLDLLHDGGPGEELAHRPRAEQRASRIDPDGGGAVGMAVTAGREHFAAPDDDDRGARDVTLRERVRQEAIEPGLRVGARQRTRRLGGLGGAGQGEQEDSDRDSHGGSPLDLQCRFL